MKRIILILALLVFPLNAFTQEGTVSTWVYDQTKDEMTDEVTRIGVLLSRDNVIALGLQNTPKGVIIGFRVMDSRYLFKTCEGCKVKIRFDDEPAYDALAFTSPDYRTIILIPSKAESAFSPSSPLVKKFGTAKVFKVAIPTIAEGSPVITFDIAGLDLQRLK